MPTKPTTKKNAPRGHSRAAQNRKLRRDALREELKSREYVRQLLAIADRLEPSSKDAYQPDQVPAVKARADILQRLLDKTLPNLRPVDVPVTIDMVAGTLSEQGARVVGAMAQGLITPAESAAVLQSLAAQVRIVEATELMARVTALEESR